MIMAGVSLLTLAVVLLVCNGCHALFVDTGRAIFGP